MSWWHEIKRANIPLGVRELCISTFVVALICSGVVKAFSQQKDPYAESNANYQLEKLLARYEQDLADFRKFTGNISFANACKVFVLEGSDVNLLVYPWRNHFSDLIIKIENTTHKSRTDLVRRFNEQENLGRQDGANRAKSEGCSYWHEHPEAVHEMREMAKAAR